MEENPVNAGPNPAPLGLIMLDSRFPRIPGDIGNAASFPFPLIKKTVSGASPALVVRDLAKGLLQPFIEAAQQLEAEGAAGITTSCGFLTLFQQELSAAVRVPVATSSLFQVPMLQAMLPREKQVGIITIAQSSLTMDHLAAAGISHQTPIGSTEGGQEFTRAILNNEPDLDVDLARKDNVDAARALVAQNPRVAAVVLECTNMAPYAADMAEATGLPVYSVIDFLIWFQRGLRPRRY
ncbi:MAG: aspartate/glutamate racemase family protein [Pseudomonadota bacterium]